jgi:methyltransferase family protein
MMFRRAVRRAVNAMGFDIHRVSKSQPAVVDINVPTLCREHVENALLYANRIEALESLPRGGVVAEIGVAAGDFTEAMLARLAPRRFDAFDLFRVHEAERFMGWSPAQVFEGLSHRMHYERRFAAEIAAGKLHLHEGDSSCEMGKQPDSFYDIIYLDGDHSYEGVMRDAEISARKLKSDGIMIFNDYIMFDHVIGVPYGIVHVVNEFCVNRGWRVLFFALQNSLFCDIALRRGGGPVVRSVSPVPN